MMNLSKLKSQVLREDRGKRKLNYLAKAERHRIK